MAKFTAGSNPADHTVDEVVEFLKGDEVTSDEHDRIMAAEADTANGGRNRSTLLGYAAANTVAASGDEVTEQRAQARAAASETDALGTRTTITPDDAIRTTMDALAARRNRPAADEA